MGMPHDRGRCLAKKMLVVLLKMVVDSAVEGAFHSSDITTKALQERWPFHCILSIDPPWWTQRGIYMGKVAQFFGLKIPCYWKECNMLVWVEVFCQTDGWLWLRVTTPTPPSEAGPRLPPIQCFSQNPFCCKKIFKHGGNGGRTHLINKNVVAQFYNFEQYRISQ